MTDDTNQFSAAAHMVAGSMLVPYDCPRSIGEGGRFELLELVSMSPRSWVYRAKDTKLSSAWFEALVAVKISRSPEAASSEALLGRRVDHPTVVGIIDTGFTDDGLPFVALEWLEGTPLSCVTGVDLKTALHWLIDLARAVQSAHSSGVIHCDLKPQNVIIDTRRRSRLTDFDLATIDGKETPSQRGTLPYMAPEQYRGELNALSPLSDIYGLGAIAFEVLTGSPPHGRDPTVISSALQENLPASVEGLPRYLDRLIARALSPVPASRYQTAQQFAEDLERYLQHRPIDWIRPSVITRLRLWLLRKPIASLLTATLMITVIAAITTWFELNRREALRDREAGEKARKIAIAAIEESQARVRASVRMITQGLLARSEEPPMEHLMPALVWTDWLSDSPILPKNGVPLALNDRLAMLNSLIDSLEQGELRRSGVAALSARLALLELQLLAGNTDDATANSEMIESVHLHAISPDDPIRRVVRALSLCVDLKKTLTNAERDELQRQLRNIRPSLDDAAVPRRVRERVDKALVNPGGME